jgi:hypothetical protein
MAASLPHFLILNDPIPGSRIPQLLGLFTHDPTSPLDQFAPSPLPAFISTYVHEYSEQTSAKVAVQSSGSETVHTKLLQAFSFAASNKESRRWDIEAAAIKTYRLENQDTAFDAIMAVASARRQIETLFRRPGQRSNRIYMIVGLKVLVDATIKAERGGGRSGEASVSASMAAVASMATIPGLGGLGADGKCQNSAESNAIVTAKHEGDLVFAVEYRVVRKSLFPNLRSKSSSVTLGKSKRWGWGEGVMGNGNGQSGEDEDSDGEVSEAKLPPLIELAKDRAVFWETL